MSTPTAVKKLTIVTAGAVLIALQIGGVAQAVVLTFDDNTSNIASISDNYGGLDWSNFSYADSSWTPAYEGSGYVNGTVSGNYVAFNRYGESATLGSSSGFDFSSAYLTAAWNNGLSITVEGLNDGTQLYSRTVVVDTTGSTLFDFNYQGIDELRFTSFGGVNAGFEDQRGREGEQFVLDNFAFNPLPTAPGGGVITDPSVVPPGTGGVITDPSVVPPGTGGVITDPSVVPPGTGGVITDPSVVPPGTGGVITDPSVVPPGTGGVITDPSVVPPGTGGVITDPSVVPPSVEIPYEPSSGLGLLMLSAFGAVALLKRKLQQKAKAKNFI